MKSRLDLIKLSDYKRSWNKSIKKWLGHANVPKDFLSRVDLPNHVSVFVLLMRIRRVLYDIYGTKRDKAESFSDSRFASFPQILNRGMISCGALATVYGKTLRRFGIPIKFVHGKLQGQNFESRHAWLKIYDPIEKKWITADPTIGDFELSKKAIQKKIYIDWSDLKKDYLLGKF